VAPPTGSKKPRKEGGGLCPLDPHRRAAGVFIFDPGGRPVGVKGVKPPGLAFVAHKVWHTPDMPDSLPQQLAAPPIARRRRWVSPLLRRVLLVNFVPLALLFATLLYLDQYQDGLLEAEVAALREQARIYAGALGESVVNVNDPNNPVLEHDQAARLLRRLTDPTPNTAARLFGPDGTLIADSRVRPGAGGAVQTEPLPAAEERTPLQGVIGRIYDWLLNVLPHGRSTMVDITPGARGPDWQPDVREEIRLASSSNSHEADPYIRRMQDGRLLVTVTEPVERNTHNVGIVLVTRDAREVDASLQAVRTSILGLFTLALILTILLSWYLSLTIAGPILHLADAAHAMRGGQSRSGAVPSNILRRRDEIGELGHALAATAAALWARMDAIERFAADVAHEIKNPLSSIRSAIDTLKRVEDPRHHGKLLAIIQEDVVRLDRLISDISDASRVDAELSRTPTHPIDAARLLRTLAEIADATRAEHDPRIVVDVPASPLMVQAVEGRLVQVLRNLIGNAESFSPSGGRIYLRARETGAMAEIAIEDEGPGIPDANLEHVFDRFYSERPVGESFGKHSGLGLSISRQIIEALQGRIGAENRRDDSGKIMGARFVVRLPLA
jgi:two-component system sensor histidine kinase ChvG